LERIGGGLTEGEVFCKDWPFLRREISSLIGKRYLVKLWRIEKQNFGDSVKEFRFLID
jgi:hypothetical protein